MTLFLIFGVFLLALVAYFKKKLTFSGSVASIFVGSVIALGLDIFGLLLLAVFFFSSTALGSFYKKTGDDIVEKGQQRDAVQVLANGGVAAIFAFLYMFIPSPIIIYGFVGSLAAANSDTWASELGSFSKQRPFHILKRKRVEVGTSGAMSLLGTAAAFAGSFIIVVCAIFFWWGDYHNSHILLLILTFTGFVGHFIDSLVGAMWQVLFRCQTCLKETERKFHCGKLTVKIKGKYWINNDIVNLFCTISGALMAVVLGWLLL